MSKRDPQLERRWRGLVSEWEESGLSGRAFCRERELREHTFYGWRRELRRRDGQGKSSGASTRPRRGPRFVQVKVAGPSWLELSLGSDLVLRVPVSVAPDRLTAILVAARRATAC